MSSRFNGLVAAIFAAVTCPTLAQTYRIADLGAVAGDTVSKAAALNAVGQAAGSSSNPTGGKATLFSHGQAIFLGTLVPGDVSFATGINGSAEVVGYEFEYSTGGTGTSHAFLYSNGALHDIYSASIFPQGMTALAINGSGVIVGQGQLDQYSFHAFVYSGGQIVDIGPPGAFQSSAAAINDAGQIVGGTYSSKTGSLAFVYSNGQFTYLTAPSGATPSAFAISSTGEIAGALYFSSVGQAHAAMYSNGVWTDFGNASGASSTHATGINASRQVIATAYFPVKSYHPFIPGPHVPYIVQSGKLVNLNTLISANSGFTLTDAIAINDAGQILCDAKNAGGSERAVLLTPK